MPIHTLDLEHVTEKSESLYEAVLIIAKRARAITAERKAQEALQESEFETTEELAQVEEIVELEESSVVIAMEDFFGDKLDIRYRTPEAEEEEEVEAKPISVDEEIENA